MLITNILIGHPVTDAEDRYNISHINTRNVVERTFGVLKMRFRCLDTTAGKLMFTPERVCRVVLACAILHNIARKHNFFGESTAELLTDVNNDVNQSSNEDISGRRVRAQLIETVFN